MFHSIHPGEHGMPVFAERLDPGPAGETDAEVESRVRLDLETYAPLPPERLAYGWVRLVSGHILYYAMPAERIPPHETEAPVGAVVPSRDCLVLPEGLDAQVLNEAKVGPYSDLRAREVLARLGQRAAADRVLGRVAMPLRVLGAVSVVLFFVAIAIRCHVAWSERGLSASASLLKEAEARADAVSTLERLSGGGRSVFDALAVVNAYRPEAVSFIKVVFSDNRELVIEGRAAGVSDINRMVEGLRGSGLFTGVETPKLDTSRGRSTFRMRLGFRRWPKITDAEAAPAAGVNASEASASALPGGVS